MADLKPVAIILIVIGFLGAIGTAISLIELVNFGTPEPINVSQPPTVEETGDKVVGILKIGIVIIFGMIIGGAVIGVLKSL